MLVNITMERKDGRVEYTRYIRASTWNDYHSWPPPGGLRYLIFHEKTNGFSNCVIRIRRVVMIDEQAFFEWARNQQKEI